MQTLIATRLFDDGQSISPIGIQDGASVSPGLAVNIDLIPSKVETVGRQTWPPNPVLAAQELAEDADAPLMVNPDLNIGVISLGRSRNPFDSAREAK